MKSWNFITFDKIAGRVTSEVKGQTVARPQRVKAGFRVLIPAVVVSAMVLAAVPTTQLQSHIFGTSSEVDLSVEAVTSNDPLRPPFYERLRDVLGEPFVIAHGDRLRAISQVGSSLDSAAHADGVVASLVDAEDEEVWTSLA